MKQHTCFLKGRWDRNLIDIAAYLKKHLLFQESTHSLQSFQLPHLLRLSKMKPREGFLDHSTRILELFPQEDSSVPICCHLPPVGKEGFCFTWHSLSNPSFLTSILIDLYCLFMLFMYFCSILIVLKIEALGESYFNAFKILFYHIYLILL